MKKPVIFAIDDDQQVLNAIARDLRSSYKKEYRILSTGSATEALEALADLKLKNEAVAMFVTDQRMPEMLGVDFLGRAKDFYPDAKRILLTAYSDIEAAIKAINEVQLDYYLMKPWDPPEEKLYPVLDDFLDDWQSAYRPEFAGIKIAGYQWSPKSHAIKDFLAVNLIPYLWLDTEINEKAKEMLRLAGIGEKKLPVVFFEDGTQLLDPDIPSLAAKVGLKVAPSRKMYDVAIIGAGPAGLAAAVYGASEGLKSVLIDKKAPGGQAGTSSRIENYLGFPSGLSGADLTRRAVSQAKRLGAEFLSPLEVVGIQVLEHYKCLKLGDGSEIHTRSIVTATGVDYRQLEIEGIRQFTGAGVYYGAATTEAQACKDCQVYIVGGGNSAGQAAMYLSKFAEKVFIVIRKDSLISSMSQYLIDQISHTGNIEILSQSVVVEAKGNGKLEELVIANLESGTRTMRNAASLFVFIGARPYTDWVPSDVIRNKRGFIETGQALLNYEQFKRLWKQERQPLILETSSPGVFAAGDVRAGAMNRVASAVGEGAIAIKLVHEYLANT